MSLAQVNVILDDGVAIFIHQPSGRWCSLDAQDLGLDMPKFYGPLANIGLTQDIRIEVENLVQSNLLEVEASIKSTEGDGRGFEYLLLKCTSACNYSCTYCYDHDEEHTSKNLDLSDTLKIVEEAIQMCSSNLTLLFHGGEPLLKKKFLQDVSSFALEKSRQYGKHIFFKIQTHGGAFNDEIIDFLTSYNFFVGISMDGPADINDKFRILKNGKGTYNKFDAAYQRYPDFMKSRCGIITTPTTVSAGHFLRVARHFRDMGFTAWRTTNYLAIGRVQDDWGFETDTDTYVDSIMALVDGIESGEFDGFYIGSVISLLNNLLTDERPDMCSPGNSPCGAGRRFLSIEADGVILPCDTLDRKDFTVGSISTDSLKSALKHRNSTVIAESLPRRDCKSCSLLGVCGGTCLGLSSLTENRPMLCKSYKKLYPALMRRLHRSDRLLTYFEECTELHARHLNIFDHAEAA